LAALHQSAKMHFKANAVDNAAAAESNNDIIERIRQLESATQEHREGKVDNTTFEAVVLAKEKDSFIFDSFQ
jgi:hypothetical protein